MVKNGNKERRCPVKNQAIYVKTPHGPGQVWRIDRGKVIVEIDYTYLVEFDPEQVDGL